ncbi:MAG: S-adenosylmethionine:tRNA ribosyltransferase-isomerase, partial [Cyclobacteriaceae bacterium]
AYETEETKQLSMQEAMQAVLDHMEARQMYQLMGETEIFIFPGYRFRVCQGLITNFHMPKSTLILLISALVGDKWKDIYQHALDNDYRFLSYGDSSLLLP